jgi:hypothetical protein
MAAIIPETYLRWGPTLAIGGSLGLMVTTLVFFVAPEGFLMVPFLASIAAFGAGMWYTLPARREQLELRFLVQMVAGGVAILDATLLTVFHANLGGWEGAFIAAHYLGGTALVILAADAIRRVTGN